jgi:hypothetical protein
MNLQHCLFLAAVLNLRHLAEAEPKVWPSAMAFAIVILLRRNNVRSVNDLRFCVDQVLLPTSVADRLWPNGDPRQNPTGPK